MYSKTLLLQVKELMERYHNNVYEISAKMHLDPVTVQNLIDIVTDMFS